MAAARSFSSIFLASILEERSRRVLSQTFERLLAFESRERRSERREERLVDVGMEERLSEEAELTYLSRTSS